MALSFAGSGLASVGTGPSLRNASPNSVLTPLIVFLRRMIFSFCVPRFLITGSKNSIRSSLVGSPSSSRKSRNCAM